MSMIDQVINEQAELYATAVAKQVYQNIKTQYQPLIEKRPEDKTIADEVLAIAQKAANEAYQKAKEQYIAVAQNKIIKMLTGVDTTQKQTSPQQTTIANKEEWQPPPAEQKQTTSSPSSFSTATAEEEKQKVEDYYASKEQNKGKKKEPKVDNRKHVKIAISGRAILATASIIAILILALILSGAVAQVASTPAINFYPNNSHIIQITGTGFEPNLPVRFELYQNDLLEYTLPTNLLRTDQTGYFSSTIIMPTSLSGTYDLVATTNMTTASTKVILPNLIPQAEPFNSTGNIILFNGTQGIQGEPGKNSAALTGTISIAVSVITLVLLLAFCAKPSYFLNRIKTDS